MSRAIFKMRTGLTLVTIVGSVLGNTSAGDSATHALGNIDVGSPSNDKNIIIGFTYSDVTTKTIVIATVGGVVLTEDAFDFSNSVASVGAGSFSGDISSLSGLQPISITLSGATDAMGCSGIVITGLDSLTPVVADADNSTGGEQVIVENLSAPVGGVAFAVGCSIDRPSTVTWGSLTKRVDVDVVDAGGHRHTAAWDLGLRVAADETLDFSGGNRRAVAGVGFR